MSVLGRLLISSAERLDLPDFLAIDSYAAGDWKYFLKGLVGDTKPYILKGFEVIDPDQSIGNTTISIEMANSMVFYPGSSAGSFFHGLESGNELAQPLTPELKKNATNYVYLTLDTVDSAQDTRSFWDPDKQGGIGGEFTQDVNTESVLIANINVSVSSFPQNTIPVCKVVVAADFIESIEDNRDLMFRLGSGGMSSSPYSRYSFKELPSVDYTRSEPSSIITNPLNPNPFQGGDKNIHSLKEWMDAVMTKLAELGGTTYWYEDTQAYSLINTFSDALATSIKSKGQWQHSEITAGKIIWTEDIISQSLQDKRDYIVRAGEKTLANDELMYIHLQRELVPNDFNYPITWFNGVNHANGSVGAFVNLKKGDWIKKTDDDSNKYLRVEEFYLLDNKGGGITAPSNAQSIKLSDVYAGSSTVVEGVFCRGVYDISDVKVEDRAAANVLNAGGDLFWLAFRSDTIMSISDITTSVLSLNITEQDGTRAKVTCTNNNITSTAEHMLEDGERISISGSTNYDGTYMVEKETDEIFYIYTDKVLDESVTAYYGIVTTAARYTSDGLLLETANHNFETDQLVAVSDTASSWDDGYTIFVKSDNKFSIPVSSNIANAVTGLATLARINVRTEVSQAKITQGEIKYVGDVDSENIQNFIGMESITQTNPNYHVDIEYNTLYGMSSYNCSPTEDLTVRASKLTSMMADKTQDKTIKFAPDYNICTKITNGTNQEIEFFRDGGSPKLTVVMNSSANDNVVNLGGTLVLANNQVAFFNVDRNATKDIADLTGLTVANIKDVPLTESVFIFAYRLDSDSVWLWDEVELTEGNNTFLHVINEILNDNVYDEKITVTSGAPTSTNEVQGPVTPGTNIPMPLDSRDGGAPQGYVVGKGVLELTLNGAALRLGDDWSEVGIPGAASTTFRIDIDLVVGDELQTRIDSVGGYIIATGGTGGAGETNYGVNIGGHNEVYKTKLLEALQFRTIKEGPGITVVQNADFIEISAGAGATLSIVTKAADYTATSNDDVILVNAATADVRINLPVAAVSSGVKLDIKKIDASSFNMIVDADGSETIDGLLTQTTNVQYESFTLVCNGLAWYIL